MGRSFSFSHAICRKPARTITEGLREQDIGTPDLPTFQAHHADYVAALCSTGAHITVLDAMDQYPDSVFVEDSALCLREGAILMRPGAPSRLGEASEIAPALEDAYSTLRKIEGPGFIDGGDILVTETEILVGTSARTDLSGIAELQAIVSDWGYSVRQLETPPGVLHFKTACSLLDAETVLSTRQLAATGCFDGYRVIYTADGEEASANAIRFNDLVVFPAGFSRTAETLDRAGFKVFEVGNTEAAKLDGGMSCLSLRF